MRPIMIIGHPGHELRAYHWMELTQPLVHVLTDGSGSLSEGRIDSTEQVVLNAGASIGQVFGGLKDAWLYEDLLSGQVDRLLTLMQSIYTDILNRQEDGKVILVGDGLEGYNTAHDLMRYMINIIAEGLRQQGYVVENYAFNLVDNPAEASAKACKEDQVLHLDDAAFQRKLDAAMNYPALKEEVETMIARVGDQAFRFELLSWVAPEAPAVLAPGTPIFYEEYGRKRVAEGKYQTLILFETHIKPFAEQLRRAFLDAIKG